MATKISSASLYVGDLSPDVTETTLFELFNQVGPVASIRVCRDTYRPNRSLGYAYVNFHNATHAEKALDTLNNTPISGKACRIMWSQRDPSLRKSGVGNIFIKNLHESIGIKELTDIFSEFGDILSCKIVSDENGKSKGFGFVHFQKEGDANEAIKKVNNKNLKGKPVFVGPFLPKRERSKLKDQSWTNVYVKNLAPEIDEDNLKAKFSEFGPVSSVAIRRDSDNNSKGFGFINFELHENALAAVDKLHKSTWIGKEIWCARHLKKREREAENKRRALVLRQQRNNSRTQGTNLYIKNLDDDVDDAKLKKEFESFGVIKSVKVMIDEKGNSKGFGFICFSNPDEARHAIETMNSRPLSGYEKPLYVALHEPKEIRRQKLIQQFAARKGTQTSNIPYQPYYPGSAQPPYVYPNAMGRVRTAGPYGYPAQYPVQISVGNPQGGRLTGNRGQGNPGRGANKNIPQQRRNPHQDEAHANVLNSVMAIPEDQRKLYLGEQLYPLIYKMEANLAGKITGMLLDSGWTVESLTSLISDPNLLHSKVQEAKEVLERAQKQETTNE